MDEERVCEGDGTDGDSVSQKSKKVNGRLLQKIRRQMEFYFSDANLEKDRFLGKLVNEEENGYVDVEVFLTFNRIRSLTNDVKVLVRAISRSEVIEVTKDYKKVHRKIPFEASNTTDERTIYVEMLPAHADYMFVKNIFKRFGSVVYASVPRCRNAKLKKFAFVEFECEDSVQAACEYYKAQKERDKKKEESESSEPEEKVTNEKEKKSTGSKSFKNKDNSPVKISRKRKRSENEKTPEKASRRSSGGAEGKGSLSKDTQLHKHDKKHSTSRKRKRQSSESDGTPKKSRMSFDCSGAGSKIRAEDKFASNSCRSAKKENTKIDNSEPNESHHAVSNKCSQDESVVREVEPASKEISVNNIKVQGGAEEATECVDSEMKSVEDPVMKAEDVNMENVIKETEGKKGKRKRKRKRSEEGLKLNVITKNQWRQFRNKYLEMQRHAMSCIKKMLLIDGHNSSDCKTQAEPTNERRNEGMNEGIVFTAGVIVKVAMQDPVVSASTLQKEIKSCVEVAYIDVDDGSKEMFLRFHHSGVAAATVKEGTLNKFGSSTVLTGEEEKVYWEKIDKDRKTQRNRQRPKKRGRHKILEKATKLVERNSHIHFED